MNADEVLKKHAAALKRINENGPSLLYMIAIPCLSTWAFVKFKMRRSSKNKPKAGMTDILFLFWFFLFNVIIASLIMYFVHKRWLPRVPGRAIGSIFGGMIGAYVSVTVEYICRMGDKKVTKAAMESPEGFVGRMWTHTIVSIVTSVAFLIMLSHD